MISFVEQLLLQCLGRSALQWLLVAALAALARHLVATRTRRLRGAVVITGCDSGFGRALAVRLARRAAAAGTAFDVFAGCLLPRSKAELRRDARSSRLHCFDLDLTDDNSVQRAARFIEEKASRGVEIVINNAG